MRLFALSATIGHHNRSSRHDSKPLRPTRKTISQRILIAYWQGLPSDHPKHDQIWGAAVNAYRNGEQWWLSETEEVEQKGQNQEFQLEHPWHGAIEFHLTYENEITISEIFKDVLKLEVQEVGRGEQMQVASILKILGFRKTGRRQNVFSQRQTIWIREKTCRAA